MPTAKRDIHSNLSRNTAAVRLALLGVLTGIFTGLVVIVFRWILETPLPLFSNASHYDDFESLPLWLRFCLPIAGSLLLALLFSCLRKEDRDMGVSHVIDKVQNLKGPMPLKNAIVQAVSTTIALSSGQSCGREGPAIHLGAASGSFLGKVFQLPHNALRLLLACGAAAAISALFNTPIAGVIFAMEVILMEYTIAGFLPVIIAAVSGSVLSRAVLGTDAIFVMQEAQMQSLLELPYVVLLGLIIGMLAGLFIMLMRYTLNFASIDLRKRLVLAGLLTGSIALFVPQIMGTGYDSILAVQAGEYAMLFLLLLLLCKLGITALTIGLGVPGGVIGPSLMMGALCGALFGRFGQMAIPAYDADPGFYVLLGMCAMMGAVLQAPLAALMAVFEISDNPELILPAMLIIVVSNLTASGLFGMEPYYQMILQRRGIKTPNNRARLLHRYGVSAIMETDMKQLTLEAMDTFDASGFDSKWALFSIADKADAGAPQFYLLPNEAFLALLGKNTPLSLPLLEERGHACGRISLHATLQQALDQMQATDREYLCVQSPLGFGRKGAVLGILHADDIIAFYHDRI